MEAFLKFFKMEVPWSFDYWIISFLVVENIKEFEKGN